MNSRSDGAVASRHLDDTAHSRAAQGLPDTISETSNLIFEKYWGRLIDDQGRETPRFLQFLRGIAICLIDKYEPKGRTALTPDAMRRYYQDTRLDGKQYPWEEVFMPPTSRNQKRSLSHFFCQIQAAYDLIQQKPDELPDVPALTVVGFTTWMCYTLGADPDREFQRLARTVRDLPVSNPDDKQERFPKELPRKLLPLHPNREMREKLYRATFQITQDGRGRPHCSPPKPFPGASVERSRNGGKTAGSPSRTVHRRSRMTTQESLTT